MIPELRGFFGFSSELDSGLDLELDSGAGLDCLPGVLSLGSVLVLCGPETLVLRKGSV